MSISYNVNVATQIAIYRCKEECCAGLEGEAKQKCIAEKCNPQHPECIELVTKIGQ